MYGVQVLFDGIFFFLNRRYVRENNNFTPQSFYTPFVEKIIRQKIQDNIVDSVYVAMETFLF